MVHPVDATLQHSHVRTMPLKLDFKKLLSLLPYLGMYRKSLNAMTKTLHLRKVSRGKDTLVIF